MVKEYLVKAFNNPNDIESRSNMLVGSAMGSTAFQKGLGAIHSLSHPIGAIYNTHHGLTNAVFMPYVIFRNKEANKLARKAGMLVVMNDCILRQHQNFKNDLQNGL